MSFFLYLAPKSEKPMDKSRISLKTAGLQRSRSDAGKDHHGEHRKPPSGLVKPTAGASFGYKKPPSATGTAAVMTAGGAAISSGSSTVGKTPRSSGIPMKPVGGGGAPSGRKNSFDASSEQSFLAPNARNSIQYRSLPRPAKSSTLSVIGRSAPRPVSGVIDPGLLTLKPVAMSSTGPRAKELGSCGGKMSNRTGAGPVNMTDREKEKERAKAKADLDCGSLKRETPSTGEATLKLHGLRRTSSGKYPELSSPTTPRCLISILPPGYRTTAVRQLWFYMPPDTHNAMRLISLVVLTGFKTIKKET